MAMATGLSVLLESQKTTHHHLTAKSPQILSKADMVRLCTRRSSPQQSLSLTSSAFLEECFLCRKHLSYEKDIYMYRGDRAFCSVECRRRQIVMDEESLRREKKNCSRVASSSPSPARLRKGAQTRARGGFVY